MDLLYWLMLFKAPMLGTHTFYKALAHFETPEQVCNASALKRKQCGLFRQKTLDYLNQADTTLVRADLDWAQQPDCRILTLVDAHYPAQLKVIADPPPVLYVRGDVRCLSMSQIAIVGSRNPTPAGIQNAAEFEGALAQLGLVVTSGMADGIDAQAHRGALEAGKPTIAICGTGLDRIYPAKHKALAHQIAMQGALVSEFAIGTAPLANNFPRRNRVISALSLGTLVVEASIKSGTMITAKLAADQGKEVFAIPGSIRNPLAQGAHQLIKDGATLVESVADITVELPADLLQNAVDNNPAICAKEIDTHGTVLLKYLSYDPMTIDTIVEKSGLSPQIVIQELLLLELSNKVTAAGNLGYALS